MPQLPELQTGGVDVTNTLMKIMQMKKEKLAEQRALREEQKMNALLPLQEEHYNLQNKLLRQQTGPEANAIAVWKQKKEEAAEIDRQNTAILEQNKSLREAEKEEMSTAAELLVRVKNPEQYRSVRNHMLTNLPYAAPVIKMLTPNDILEDDNLEEITTNFATGVKDRLEKDKPDLVAINLYRSAGPGKHPDTRVLFVDKKKVKEAPIPTGWSTSSTPEREKEETWGPTVAGPGESVLQKSTRGKISSVLGREKDEEVKSNIKATYKTAAGEILHLMKDDTFKVRGRDGNLIPATAAQIKGLQPLKAESEYEKLMVEMLKKGKEGKVDVPLFMQYLNLKGE